jgi:hypothetical protein
LLDEQGNAVMENLTLTKDGNNLSLEVDGESVANIEEFYSVDGSQYVIDGSAVPAENMVVSSAGVDASGNVIANGAVWQAESGFLGLSTLQLVGAGVGSAVVVGALASGSSSDSGSSPATDSTAPTNTFTDAAYDEASNTLTLTGTNMNTLLFDSEDSSTDIKNNFDWDNLQWDIGSDDTGNITFGPTDIDSVYVTDDNTLSITLTDASAAALESLTGFDDLTEDNSIAISTGFSGDTAGNVSATDAYVGEAAMDTSIVVFDLVNGESSSHSDRTFDADVTYSIYVIVDSDSINMNGGSSILWIGAQNLGGDDFVFLVSNDGNAILGFSGNPITDANDSRAYFSKSGFAAEIRETGSVGRRYSGSTATANGQIWRSTGATPTDIRVGTLSGAFTLTALPSGVMTSQGLA